MALLVSLALYLTNPFFTILDDEINIISAANAPIAATLRLFLVGEGQHEHPPLSDLLLHFWLPVAGVSTSLVRVPSIVFYSVGLVVLAEVARRLSGKSAFYMTLIIGAFWPFGFHFGRMAGWYSFCFLFVALLTLAYLHFLDAPSYRRWALVILTSYVLIASNYFGWVVVGLIGLDLLISLPGRQAYRYFASSLVILAAGYGPLWVTFVDEVRSIPTEVSAQSVAASIVKSGFNFYSLFVSESVAPWFWRMSISAGVAILLLLGCTLRLTQGKARRFFLGFLTLFTAMASLGIMDLKRLLFISGWLLVAIGVALANSTRRRARNLLAGSLVVIWAIGWAGIVTRKYYASLHFIEPWATIADGAARQIGQGRIVVSNNPVFLFYLNGSLYRDGLSSINNAGTATGPNVISLVDFGMPENGPKGKVMFVRGVNLFATERTASAEVWMASHCRLESTTQLLRDSGYELKQRLFPRPLESAYRITIEQLDCNTSN